MKHCPDLYQLSVLSTCYDLQTPSYPLPYWALTLFKSERHSNYLGSANAHFDY